MPGRCSFYEFQKMYLKKLVELKYVVIDLEAGMGGEAAVEARGFVEEEAQSKWDVKLEKNSMELKMDAMISLLKKLFAALIVLCIVGIMFVLK